MTYYLNPQYKYSPGVGENSELIKAIHDVYSTLDPKSTVIG